MTDKRRQVSISPAVNAAFEKFVERVINRDPQYTAWRHMLPSQQVDMLIMHALHDLMPEDDDNG